MQIAKRKKRIKDNIKIKFYSVVTEMHILKDWQCLFFLIKTVEEIYFHMWLWKSKLVQVFETLFGNMN